MKTLQQIGIDIGNLVAEKNAAYGSSFAKAGDFLRLLFPDGVPPHRYDDALLLVRIFDKQMRIATDCDAFGESPYQDIAGYGVCGVHHNQKEIDRTCPGFASTAAEGQSKDRHPGSAPSDAAGKTSTSASAKDENAISLPPANSSAPSPCASVPTATADANASAEGQQNLGSSPGKNSCGSPLRCPICNEVAFFNWRRCLLNCKCEGQA